jgi:hypothetical protein
MKNKNLLIKIFTRNIIDYFIFQNDKISKSSNKDRTHKGKLKNF